MQKILLICLMMSLTISCQNKPTVASPICEGLESFRSQSGVTEPVDAPSAIGGAYFYYDAAKNQWFKTVGRDLLTRPSKESIARTKLTIERLCP